MVSWKFRPSSEWDKKGHLKQFRDDQRSPKKSEQNDNNFEGSSKLTK